MVVFEQEMAKENEAEQMKLEESLQTLQEEKQKIVADRKHKLQEKISEVSDDTEQRQKIIQSHSEDTQKLINKIDAAKIRVESNLQEQLQKRRKSKLIEKEAELQLQLLKKKKEQEEKEQQQKQRLAEQEKKKLEAIQESLQESYTAEPDTSEAATGQVLSPAVQDGLPLSQEQLTSLLLATPLYQKLERIRELLEKQPFLSSVPTSIAPGGYIDPKDAQWVNDTELHPVDVSTLSARAFIVYKFGCSIISLLSNSGNHDLVSLLLADKIPPNHQLKRNAFRNSFAYDGNNKILYLRLQRLDNVGDFVLVLVHTLSHIKVRNLVSDWDSKFLQEFYRSLSICCSRLFFSSYRQTSHIANEFYNSNSEQSGAYNFLENVFESATSGAEKCLLVDDLVDSRVMMYTDKDGLEFSHDSVMKRMSNYEEFKPGSSLRSFLDKAEPDNAHLDAQHHYKEPFEYASPVTKKDVSKLETTQSLVTKSKWKAAMKLATAGSQKVPKPNDRFQNFIQMQINDLQEKVDTLNEEYALLTKEKMELGQLFQQLEEDISNQNEKLKSTESGSSEYDSQKQVLKDTTSRLNAAKANIATTDLRLSACSKRLDGFKIQLEQKQLTLKQHTFSEIMKK